MSAVRDGGPGRTAVLFPGLAPTRHAKAADFLTSYPPATTMLATVDEALGYSLMARYRTAEVYDWEVYQSAHLVTILALVHARLEGQTGGTPTIEPLLTAPVLCGQSFGSFAAAVQAGCIDLAELIDVLRHSSRLEQEYFATEPEQLGCVFFTRLTSHRREQLIRSALKETHGWLDLSVEQDRGVSAVSGTRRTVDRLAELIRQDHGVVFYVMNRAEHCTRMEPLVQRLREEVYKDAAFRDPRSPLVSDHGVLLETGEQVRQDLAGGWSRPLIAEQLYSRLESLGIYRILAPASRGSFSRFGEGRFEVEILLPNATLEACQQASTTEGAVRKDAA